MTTFFQFNINKIIDFYIIFIKFRYNENLYQKRVTIVQKII